MISALRLVFRQFARTPGFTFVAVLTLALGIGANTAFFSVINNTLLRPLPYPNQDRIVQIDEVSTEFNRMSVSYPNFLDWQQQQSVFSSLALFNANSGRFKTAGSTEQVSLCFVTSEFFSTLGVSLLQGNLPTAENDKAGSMPVAWLTYATWQKFFHGAPDVVGKSVLIDDRDVSIGGILPASFRFTRNVDIYLPIAPYALQNFMTMRENHSGANVLGLLKPDVTLAAAQKQFDTIAERLQHEYPAANSGINIHAELLRDRLSSDSRTNLLLLSSAVGMVLLIACVNLANMLLARSFSRLREMAIRTALGATRAQLIRQLFIENLALATLGGSIGLLLGLWGYSFIERLIPWNMKPLLEGSESLDYRVLAFTILATFLTGIGFGLAPAWQLSQSNPNEALKQTPRIVNTRWGRWHLRDILVGVQVSLALILLVGASLLIRSLQSILAVDPGIRPAQVLTLHVEPPPLSEFQSDPDSLTRFHQRTIEAVQNLPGVECAAVVSSLPFSWNNSYMVFYVEGRPLPEEGKFPSASNHTVSENYFKALGIPLIRGRIFDGHESQPVFPKGVPFTPENLPTLYKGITFQGVISKSMAEQFWPGEDALGKRFRIGFPYMGLPFVEVIGIVGDVTQNGLDRGPLPEYYLSQRQFGVPNYTHLILRAAAKPSSIASTVRTALKRALPDNPVTNLRPMTELLDERISGRKFNLRLFVFFAGTALLLALIGLYGVLAFVVGQRTREIGIRMALGARRANVLCDIIKRGLWLVVPGLVLGGVAAWLASRFLQSQLYAVTRNDLTSYLISASLLLIAAIVACLLPARRATKINPIEALRAE